MQGCLTLLHNHTPNLFQIGLIDHSHPTILIELSPVTIENLDILRLHRRFLILIEQVTLRAHAVSTMLLANHPNTVILDPSTFVSICEHCNARNDHDTFECPHPCQSMECSSKLVQPHAHKDCPWFGAEFDQF